MNDILTIIIENGTKRIRLHHSAKIIIAEGGCGYRTINSEIAEWLYLALAGHSIYQRPETVCFSYAYAARAIIQHRQALKPAWRLAQEVIEQWGWHIQPWLGYVRMTADGHVIENAPEYTTCFCLVTGRETYAGGYFMYIGER